jgi:short-subunit dehydrogenase
MGRWIEATLIPVAALCLGTQNMPYKSYPVLAPKDSVVIVTGAKSGLGLDSAVGLANKGYTVWAGMRASSLNKTIPELDHPNIKRIALDVTNPDDVAALELSLQLQNVTLAAYVANAGVAPKIGYAAFDEDVEWTFDVNVFGVMRVYEGVREALTRSDGRLVIITSLTGIAPLPGLATYSATKHAVEGWAQALRMENTLPVSTVVDGFIRTAITTTGEHDSKPGWPYKSNVLVDYWMDLFNTQLDEHTNAVTRAVSDKFPRHRYVVGWDASLVMGAVWFFPGWIVHLFIAGLNEAFRM